MLQLSRRVLMVRLDVRTLATIPQVHKPIGFIGLGMMGKCMAARLINKLDNAHLIVWNRNKDVGKNSIFVVICEGVI